MKEKELIKRYAQALVDLAVDVNQLDKVREDLEFICQIFKEQKEIGKFLQHPKVSSNKKKDFIYNTLSSRITDVSLSFLYLLLEKRRINLLSDFKDVFKELVDEEKNLVHAQVKSVVELTEEESKLLCAKLEKRLNKTVILDKKIEKKILGGVTVKIGDKLIDGSIYSALQKMRQSLLTR